MVIGLDMDGVICDLVPEWLNRYNNDYDDCLTKDHIKSWNMGEHVKCGKAIYDYLADESLYDCATVIDGAVETTKHWIDEGHDVIVITRVHYPYAAAAKLKWLQTHFPHLTNIVIVTSDIKYLVNADVLIDDGSHNLELFKGLRILMTRPWNKSLDQSFIRVDDWSDLSLAIMALDVFRTKNDLRLYHESGCNTLLQRLKAIKREIDNEQSTNTFS